MSSSSNKEYSVNWSNHMNHVRKAFDQLLSANEFTDVTLYCEGRKLTAHKMLLSACSGYFREIFKDVPCQHPIIILSGIELSMFSSILHFIYNGEVSIDKTQLETFLKTAQILQISGLTECSSNSNSVEEEVTSGSDITETHNSEQIPNTSTESVTASTTGIEPRKSNKRALKIESGTHQESPKIIRTENDSAVFMTDIKTEPNELVNFEETIEDPLQPSELNQDTKELFEITGIQTIGEEEFKRDAEIKQKHFRKRQRTAHLNLNGYSYCIDKRDVVHSRIYWRCRKHKSEHCTGRLITDLEHKVIRISAEHVHPPCI